MTPLYLQRIALRQFRSFATLDVEIPAMPGVLIVHGSNGLGKSSLFGLTTFETQQVSTSRGRIFAVGVTATQVQPAQQ